MVSFAKKGAETSAHMRTFLIIASFVTASVLQSAYGSDPEALVEQIKKIAKPESDMGTWSPAFVYFPDRFFTQQELELANELRGLGTQAIHHLLPLLHSENPAVKNLAYYTLAQIDGWTAEHLDALIASRRGGDDWIPLAIAKIGTPRAASFLVEELFRSGERFGQLSGSVAKCGEKAVPPLVRIYQTENAWDAELENTMYYVFKRLNDKAVGAIEPLLKLANDEAEPGAKRFRAVKALGAIGPSALLQLLDSKSGFLTTLSSAESAGDPDTTEFLMRDIANLRAHGTPAGPLVIKFLNNEHWQVRIAAARALGRIGYKEAANELITLLQRSDDWRLAFRAAESLGLLKSEEALSPLVELSQAHWYPPVRNAALQAINRIQRQTRNAHQGAASDRLDDFFDDHGGDELEFLADTESEKLKLPALPPPPGLHVKIKAHDGALHVKERRGIQIGDGYLVGTDNGEWGGEIAFIDGDGNSHLVAHENTEAIYKTAAGIFAVTGLAHMGANSGFIFKIQKGAGQQWTAEKWRALPGAPRFSRLLENGSLFVSCHGGIVLVSPAGEMKSMTRSECLQVPRR